MRNIHVLDAGEVQAWACLNPDHKCVAWDDENVAHCGTCGLTSAMTSKFARDVLGYAQQAQATEWASAMGVTDPGTWRAIPAACNQLGNPSGAWAVVAGDGEECDIYCTVTAEYPQWIAELIASAIRAHAGVEAPGA